MLFLLLFFVHFQPNFTHSPYLTLSPYVYLSYALFTLTNRQQEHIWLVLLVTDNSIYLATNIPKQSCSSAPTWSCTGTSSAALACSHSSKFQTSWTQSTSRSASTAWSPLLITRFLVSTTVRSPWPTASIWQTTSSDLVRDMLNPAGTGKVITPATRFTATLSYRVSVRMPNLPEETFQWNAVLAGTYGKRNKTGNHRNWNRRSVLKQREIVHLHVFFCLFQEHNIGFQLLGTKDRVVLRIRIPGSQWRTQSQRGKRNPRYLAESCRSPLTECRLCTLDCLLLRPPPLPPLRNLRPSPPPLTRGEGAWKPMKTSWVHCRLWLKVPTTYPPITDWVHSKCSQIMCSTWNLWEHLCNIWNVTSTCTPHLIPHNS